MFSGGFHHCDRHLKNYCLMNCCCSLPGFRRYCRCCHCWLERLMTMAAEVSMYARRCCGFHHSGCRRSKAATAEMMGASLFRFHSCHILNDQHPTPQASLTNSRELQPGLPACVPPRE